MVGGGMIARGCKTIGGKICSFPQLVINMHIFSPIDFKFTELQKIT